MPGSLSTICKTFVYLYHFTLLWWRGFYPTFLFFEFLKKSCIYQIQIWHAYKANKVPSDQYLNEDISAEQALKLAKKLFLVPISIKGGSIHLRQIVPIPIKGWWISPTPVPLILTNRIRFPQNFECCQKI